MVTFAKLEPGTVESLPFGDLMLAHVLQTEESLTNAAMVSFSAALGNHPELLNSDRQYFNFVATYISDGLVPYAEKAAAAQLGLLSIAGSLPTQSVFAGFSKELAKVQKVVLPNEEAAELILSETERSWNFFLAVVAAAGIVCQRDPRLAGYYGIKKTLFGNWRRAV